MKVDILGVGIDNVTYEESLLKIEELLKDERQHYVVTPNPEFVVRAQKDGEFKKILNQADLAVADGFGLVLASRYFGKPLKQRVAGVDLMEKICKRAAEKNWLVYLIGGREGIAREAARKLAERYPRLQIKALENQDLANLDSAVSAVSRGRSENPAILFVALGAPKQEKWIWNNLNRLKKIRLAMGVGGAFDFMAGQTIRAPKIVRKLGLEWCWRFICQPWRAKRIYRSIIQFPWLVIKSKL